MQQITQNEIKKIQLNILDYIHSFCQGHRLSYFLMFGSLLGAVRHKGFIPWDDDIDVAMPAKDYAMFIDLMKKETYYDIVCAETDPDYYFHFARVSDKSTTLKFRAIREIHNLGVFVDVFPINECPSNDKIFEWKKEYQQLRHKVFATVPNTAKYQDASLKTLINRLRILPARTKFGVNNFMKYRTELLNLISKYNGTNAYYCSCGFSLDILTSSSFSDYAELEFEGNKYRTPKNYDKVLTELYGNYYLLPPENKRVSHHHFTAYWKL